MNRNRNSDSFARLEAANPVDDAALSRLNDQRPELSLIVARRDAVLPRSENVDGRGEFKPARIAKLPRGRPIRRRHVLVAVASLAIGVLVTAPALAVATTALDPVFGGAPAANWAWPEGVPGQPVAVSDLVRSAAQGSGGGVGGVDVTSIREVARAGSGRTEITVLAGRDANGQVCLAETSDGGASQFSCLPTDASATSSLPAVLRYGSEGGARGSEVSYATIAGVVRSDVKRLELQLVDGRTIDLALNSWRGFSYSTTDPSAFPKTLFAYQTWKPLFHTHEKLVEAAPIQTLNVAPSPLCGGSQPCPDGVTP